MKESKKAENKVKNNGIIKTRNDTNIRDKVMNNGELERNENIKTVKQESRARKKGSSRRLERGRELWWSGAVKAH